MEIWQIMLIGVGALLGLACIAFAVRVFSGGGAGGQVKQSELRGLMGTGAQTPKKSSAPGMRDRPDYDIDEIKRLTLQGERSTKKKSDDLETKLFKAGIFGAEEKRKFSVFRIMSFGIAFAGTPGGLLYLLGDTSVATLGIALGAFIGLIFPLSYLDRKIRHRQEETLYYLPLVIEQVSIGVSSSLDIGPCIAQIVEMAGERDSHNPVTEMFVHSQRLMRSGMNLEESLVEVGEANGMAEVKHAFMFLAQCARHGGEVTKQLQELADSVMVQRQVQVEGKITALPVKATGPLATVFAGFFALLFAGLVVRLVSAFGG